jgi:hypothetical protein
MVGDNRLKAIGRVHDTSFRARYPELGGVSMEYRWRGLLCLSLNCVTALGKIGPGLFSACLQNGLGTAKGTSQGVLAAELASGLSFPHLEYIIAQDLPKRLPPEPFSSIGANAYMRFGEWKAGSKMQQGDMEKCLCRHKA